MNEAELGLFCPYRWGIECAGGRSRRMRGDDVAELERSSASEHGRETR